MILITGNTGFIGTHLTSFLLSNNYKNLSFLGRKTNPDWDTVENIDDIETVIHLSGLAHDIEGKNTEKDYFNVNYILTKKIYDLFLESKSAKTFIFISTIAVRDSHDGIFSEEDSVRPFSFYGKTKRMAEEYIMSKMDKNRHIYILRPCMVHGENNKGNLNLLYSFVRKGIPYPLGAFNNSRSFLSIDNFCFIIKELIDNKNISSGIYHLADTKPVSVKSIIELISTELNKQIPIFNIPKVFIKIIGRIGDFIPLPINSKKIEKLTQNYIVSNKKIIQALGKELPVNSEEGLMITLKSLNNGK